MICEKVPLISHLDITCYSSLNEKKTNYNVKAFKRDKQTTIAVFVSSGLDEWGINICHLKN